MADKNYSGYIGRRNLKLWLEGKCADLGVYRDKGKKEDWADPELPVIKIKIEIESEEIKKL